MIQPGIKHRVSRIRGGRFAAVTLRLSSRRRRRRKINKQEEERRRRVWRNIRRR